MTTGNVTFGSRSESGPDWIGHFTTKEWNGADRPSNKPTDAAALAAFLAVPHPYLMYLSERSQSKMSVAFDIGWPNQEPYWVDRGEHTPEYLNGRPDAPRDPWSSNHDLQLLVKLKEEVYGGSANIAVTVAEMGETLDTLASVTRRLARLTDAAIRAGRRKNSFKAVKAMTRRFGRRVMRGGLSKAMKDQWLEYRYAVMPLMYDIDSHCQTLANLHNRVDMTKFRARVKAVDAKTDNLSGFNWGTTKLKHSCVATAAITTKANSLLVYSGVSDPASVLWEKIPYSFVIDWIVPVGDFLAAVDFWRKTEGMFTFSHRIETTCQGLFYKWTETDRSPWKFGDGSSYMSRSLTLDRKVASEVPIPYPSLDTTIGHSTRSLKRAIDAVALFAQPRLRAGY